MRPDRLADREGAVRARRSASAASTTRCSAPGAGPATAEDSSPRTASRRCPPRRRPTRPARTSPPRSVAATGTADVAACLQARARRTTVEQAAYTPGDGYQYGGQGTVAPTINGTTLTMNLRQALRDGTREPGPCDRRAPTATRISSATATTAAQYPAAGRRPSTARTRPRCWPSTRSAASTRRAWPGGRSRRTPTRSARPCHRSRPRLAGCRSTEYEIDDNDIPPYRASGPDVVAAGSVARRRVVPNAAAPPLDANQQVLQNQELAYVTTFARTGRPTTTARRRGRSSIRATTRR